MFDTHSTEGHQKSIKPQDFKVYTLHNYKQIPQISKLSEEQKFEMEVVAQVLPFKSNAYVVNELINWDNVPDDPMFVLTFPQKGMLLPHHFERIASLMRNDADKKEINEAANDIRLELNPHPAGQLDLNVPELDGEKIYGMQHKYRETALFFPSQGQTCHAYCTFCFRWPQFVGMDDMKFASKEVDQMVRYMKAHPETTNILFTGGDPMVMSTTLLERYIEPLLVPELENLHTIRIGTKALAYWPYKFINDKDTPELLRLFEKVAKTGRHVALMAHFNHFAELETKAVKKAIKNLRDVNVEIRTQSPLLRHINDDYKIWLKMWRMQVKLGCIPYYMFLARDTGAQHYFSVGLERAYQIYRNAYMRVSGISRTVRGPSMSASPGKIHLVGVADVQGEKVYVLQFLQGRNPQWVRVPFFAKYDPDAVWLDDLKPAFGEEKFFWQDEYEKMVGEKTVALKYQDED
ncbi:MAG TPA: lysine 2,3-aminomutase [Bacteroidales bacterium]|nr:lysine 2,3-aminomutase [Bacteroidales bacterium]